MFNINSHRVQSFLLAHGSVRVRRTVVGPYRVRSKVRVSI